MGSAPFSLFSRVILAPIFSRAYSFPATLFCLSRKIKMTDSCGFQVLVLLQGHFSIRPDSPCHQLTEHGFRHQPEESISLGGQRSRLLNWGATLLLICRSLHTHFYVNGRCGRVGQLVTL
jgi:hypothetical protein